MKCLLIGGAGFIARNLILELLERNHSVTVLDDYSRTGLDDFRSFIQRMQIEDKIRRWAGDLPYAFTFEGFFDQRKKRLESVYKISEFDVIFHLVALTSVPKSWEQTEHFIHTNVTGTWSVLEVAKQMGVKKVVFISSAAVYGSPPEDFAGWIETDNLNPTSPYGLTKKHGEDWCKLYQSLGLDIVIARLSNVYGPEQPFSGGYSSVIPVFLNACLNNESPIIHGDGKQERDFIFVKDVVYALAELAVNNRTGIFNIGSGKPTSILEVFNLLRENFSHWSHFPIYYPKRERDVDKNFLNISKLKLAIGEFPKYNLAQGLYYTKQYLRGGTIVKSF